MRQANRRQYHYIYKTTCVVTGKYYLGMHSTDNLYDGYQGSGKRLGYSIRKHGKENHVVEILEHYFTREWLREREAELVCAETLTDPMCMNLKIGGAGGWDHIVRTKEERIRISCIAGKAAATIFFKNPEKLANRLDKAAIGRKGRLGVKSFIGKNHTQATKDKMSATHALHGKSKGDNNSQYGKCWIFSPYEKKNMKVERLLVESYLVDGWFLGRKMKF